MNTDKSKIKAELDIRIRLQTNENDLYRIKLGMPDGTTAEEGKESGVII